MLRALLFALALCICLPSARAQQSGGETLQSVLQRHAEEVADPGRRSVGTVIEDLVASGLPGVSEFLERWQNKGVFVRESDGLFFYAEPQGNGYALTDISTLEPAGTASDMTEIRPNGGVRRVIGAALVQFQLSDPDRARRVAALDAIERSPDADQIDPLTQSIENEPDPAIKRRKERLAGNLAARFADTTEERVAAIERLSSELDVQTRSVLNLVLASTARAAPSLPEDANIARVLTPGTDITEAEAYARLVAADLAPPAASPDQIKALLTSNIVDGRVGGVPVGQLNTDDGRARAYAALIDDVDTDVPALVTNETRAAALSNHVFFEEYAEPDPAITDAARAALDEVEARVARNQMLDISLDALSLASIYFLAAIGLAVTFGVMGVINMAHGEFIMMGAYTGYVVQQIIPDYTASLLVALPLAFAVTFAAGVAMERLVIRHLYHRPLETLLATFGISIALQQLAKNIFGTQARPLTSPGWLDGAWVINDVVQIANIRIAIFVLALLFLGLILFILNKTRLGLEVRAVTQNPGMAASMGINPGRINMLTFGMGSGIAGIAGVAIGLYAKVTSEMGADYIVQSFMTVVVGGVGNVWGTLAGATLIGGLQKGIEWFNPSNTLAAQTYMILFIILFIQFRPKGIVALKGRAAGD
ncbi:urea ABC transporter permease subunit UrtB [Thalassococcus profundi]|uniref:Urea ABC transporter permease subunit UrtB n=1 Tax=Thalassococcus profundi TaxID=2282382 RepID=A0A369TLE7_9RHOB|nr:urea ABC transporter permease subunit UrtB [Thalassococcus profundi]RDD66050.1 urea ABC transporter permease subunit UrtB [Thalassococcus profundi]